MHPNPHISDYELATERALLFVGFHQSFDDSISNFPHQSPHYRCFAEENGFLAFRWLESRVQNLQTYHLPYAVLCHLDWLEANKYHLAQQVGAHPDLCSVPFVAFSPREKAADKAALAANGVDDCYTFPVDWEILESRLEFLNQFKPRMLEESARIKPESFKFQIPLEKRVFDIIGATLGLLLSAWIWAPVMLAIWLESRGPVLYKSKRVGFGYQVFEFLKFRSMYADADQQLQAMQHLNQYAKGSGKAIFVKISGDPRITRVGRFIRKYSIDELPQLINVLRGEMSLVGNRPLPIYEAEALTRDEWSARFLAPAGITGLWQVTKRGQANMTAEERIRLDISYSQKPYSVWNDLAIALKTFRVFIQKEDV